MNSFPFSKSNVSFLSLLTDIFFFFSLLLTFGHEYRHCCALVLAQELGNSASGGSSFTLLSPHYFSFFGPVEGGER